jgi:hypothetical protein
MNRRHTTWLIALLLAVPGGLAIPGIARADATVDLIWESSGTDTRTAVKDDIVFLDVYVTAGPSGVKVYAFDVDYSDVVPVATPVQVFYPTAATLDPFDAAVLGDPTIGVSAVGPFNATAVVLPGLLPGEVFYAGTIEFAVVSSSPGTYDLVPTVDPVVQGFLDADDQNITATTTLNGATLVIEAVTSPEIDVVPMSVDFGDTAVGATSLQIVTVTNVGDDDLTLGSVDLAAGSDPAFAIDAAPASGTVLGPMASADVELSFAPTDGSAATGTLEIASDDGDEPLVSVALAGQGVTADQEIMEILQFFDDADLESTQGNRDRGMRSLLESAGDFIDRGQIDQACHTLADALLRVDGIEPPDSPPVPDFVEGDDAAALAAEIEDLRELLGCDPPRVPSGRCGLGAELVFVLPPLLAWRRRRR